MLTLRFVGVVLLGVVALAVGLVGMAVVAATPANGVSTGRARPVEAAQPLKPTAEAAQAARPSTDAAQATQVAKPIQVFFSRHPDSDDDFTRVFPATRTAPDEGVARAALESLIQGPTPKEQAGGYFSELGEMLRGP
ncbi:MAG: hypothetical protein H0V51_12840 [Chloroflexi bacterium]|nr:hypothetical protein [Chloroflexota bacterium]